MKKQQTKKLKNFKDSLTMSEHEFAMEKCYGLTYQTTSTKKYLECIDKYIQKETVIMKELERIKQKIIEGKPYHGPKYSGNEYN